MVEFNLLTFPCLPLRKKEHKSYFDKNRTHDLRTTSGCAGSLLDHSDDEHKNTLYESSLPRLLTFPLARVHQQTEHIQILDSNEPPTWLYCDKYIA